MKLPRPSVLAVLSLIALPILAADPAQEITTRQDLQSARFHVGFRPFKTATAALSPDGKYIAYTVHEKGVLSIVVIDLDHPERAISKTAVVTDEAATPMMQDNIQEKTPGSVRWMRWVTPTRLVAETNRSFATMDDATKSQWIVPNGEIVALDADGGNARVLLTPHDVRITSGESLEQSLQALGMKRPEQWTVDKPVNETLPEEFADTQQSTPSQLEARSYTSSPTSPRIFDLDPEHPGCVLVRAGTQKKTILYRLDAVTGKLTVIEQEIGPEGMATLLDRQARIRASVPNVLIRSFPHAYAVDRGGLLRWTVLDKVVRETTNAPFTVTPETFFGERSFPVGIDEDPNLLYYASNAGRDTYGLYGLNIKTGERTPLALENPGLDLVEPSAEGFGANPLIFDRFTRRLLGVKYENRIATTAWLHRDWQTLQTNLEKAIPGHIVEVLEWDQNAKRFLVLARAPSNPGAFYVFEPATGKLTEIAGRAPWMEESSRHRSIGFTIPGADTSNLTGILTIPRATRITPVPVVVVCQPEPWLRARAEYRADVYALAQMGFAVVQLNPRGVWGFGRKHREAALNASEGFETVQVEDIVTTLDHLSKAFPLSPKHVAIFGEKRGGYLALRAVQLRPDRFRCAIVIDATVDIKGWLAENRWDQALSAPVLVKSFFNEAQNFRSPLKDDPEKITNPTLFLHYPGPEGAPRTFAFIAARNLHTAIRRHGHISELVELTRDYVHGHSQARSETFGRIEDFLNENIYAYNVQLGETEVKDDNVKSPPATK